MLSIEIQAINPQSQSPLFTTIPTEIRHQIFSFASTPSYNKSKTYPINSFHYRPLFRYAHQISPSLPLLCRRVYLEAHSLLPITNTHTEWHASSRGPPTGTAKTASHPSMVSAHLFMQQCRLESWHPVARRLDAAFIQLRELKITIRHSDWWLWENSEPLALDPKYTRRPSHVQYRKPEDEFASGSWGLGFVHFRCLQRFEMELETREGKMAELDEILGRAVGWRFPLKEFQGERRELVCDEKETRRLGWIGAKLPSGRHIPNDPLAGKQRLIAAGVDFSIPDCKPEITGSSEECIVYYVVSLIWHMQRIEGHM